MNNKIELEIGRVLFINIIGYSKLLLDEQKKSSPVFDDKDVSYE